MAQQTHNVAKKALQRRCNVKTLQRCCCDVVCLLEVVRDHFRRLRPDLHVAGWCYRDDQWSFKPRDFCNVICKSDVDNFFAANADVSFMIY